MLFELKDFSLSYDVSTKKGFAKGIAPAGKLVLKRVNISIEKGENVALIGKSGVGKSSLLNVLYEQQPTQTAYCTQDKQLIKGLSCYNNIYLARLAEYSVWRNVINLITPNKSSFKEISAIAASLQVAEFLPLSVNKTSGGQQQRIAVARALYQKRDVFLGDEPVSSLDPVIAKHVLEEILQRHSTNIVALHDRGLALDCFDRIIGLKQGCVMIDAQSKDVSLADLEPLYL